MIQEYLLQDDMQKESIKNYKKDGVKTKLYSIDDGKCWCVSFSSSKNDEDAAKLLSEIDEYIQSTYKVTVLEDGSSIYFSKRLFPMFCEFEHKLRKLLYLMSALKEDEKSSKNIADLETQDLGQIFSMLFIDPKFIGKVKDRINKGKNEEFSKTATIALIESIDENTTWDQLLEKDVVPTLRREYDDVRLYRNDVMHFHNINWERFKSIQSLIKKIIKEIDDTILNIKLVEIKAPNQSSFNQILETSINLQKLLGAISDNIFIDQNVLKSISLLNSVLSDSLLSIQVPKNALISSETLKALQGLKGIPVVTLSDSTLSALSVSIKEATNVSDLLHTPLINDNNDGGTH